MRDLAEAALSAAHVLQSGTMTSAAEARPRPQRKLLQSASMTSPAEARPRPQRTC
jgi:hypothetical protein